MISTSKTPSARYLVFSQSVNANGATLEKRFCNTIREARTEAVKFCKRFPARYAISNGYTPANVPAAMVANSTKRYGRLLVIANHGETRSEIGIIAL